MQEMMQWRLPGAHPGSQPNPPGLMTSRVAHRGGVEGVARGGAASKSSSQQHHSEAAAAALSASSGGGRQQRAADVEAAGLTLPPPPGSVGGGGKPPDASKIIYCPFSEEVKQQRYQQDPNQNFVCPVCGQMFPSFNYLANHMVNHLPSETISKGPGDGNKIHICKVCNKSFSRSDMLTRHMRLHTGLRPYECRICGQVFSRSDHLHTHNRTHTGEKPYRCPHCPYAAPRRDMITRHMRIHAKQWPKRGRRSSSAGSCSDTPQSSSFSSSQESSSADSEAARRQSHSLSSMESLESPGVLHVDAASPHRVSLSALEHSSAAAVGVDSLAARPRQWSSESYEASDERTPSTPGSANRFFTHHWQMTGASAAAGDGMSLTPASASDTPPSPKKRQWTAMAAEDVDDDVSASSSSTLGFYSRVGMVSSLRTLPKQSTGSFDTDRTLESVSSVTSETASQSSEINVELLHTQSQSESDLKSESESLSPKHELGVGISHHGKTS